MASLVTVGCDALCLQRDEILQIFGWMRWRAAGFFGLVHFPCGLRCAEHVKGNEVVGMEFQFRAELRHQPYRSRGFIIPKIRERELIVCAGGLGVELECSVEFGGCFAGISGLAEGASEEDVD